MNLPTCISSNRKIRYTVCFVILITLSVLFFIISVCAGSVQIPLSDIWRQFRGEQDELYAAILFQSGCRAPSDAGASSGNNDDLVGFSCHDYPPENVDLVRVYRMAERLSIGKASHPTYFRPTTKNTGHTCCAAGVPVRAAGYQ